VKNRKRNTFLIFLAYIYFVTEWASRSHVVLPLLEKKSFLSDGKLRRAFSPYPAPPGQCVPPWTIVMAGTLGSTILEIVKI
jgi:hypothetical protein